MTLNDKIDALKNLLICGCLVGVLVSSCRRDRTADEIVAELSQLRLVVMNDQTDDGQNDDRHDRDDEPVELGVEF